MTDTLGAGTATVTCSATDVTDMSWTIDPFFFNEGFAFKLKGPTIGPVNFSTILRSVATERVITEGITLLSEVTITESNGVYSTVQSTMIVSPSLSGPGELLFYCMGYTVYGGPFLEFTLVELLEGESQTK